MSRLDREHSQVMSDVGERVRARRKALGMTQDDLAGEAGINRDTLGAIENGLGYRASSLTKIEEALARLEDEAGMSAAPPQTDAPPSPHLVRFTVKGVYGAEALTVEGPVEDIAALEAAVDRIMRRIQGRENGPDVSAVEIT